MGQLEARQALHKALATQNLALPFDDKDGNSSSKQGDGHHEERHPPCSHHEAHHHLSRQDCHASSHPNPTHQPVRCVGGNRHFPGAHIMCPARENSRRVIRQRSAAPSMERGYNGAASMSLETPNCRG